MGAKYQTLNEENGSLNYSICFDMEKNTSKFIFNIN